MSLIIYILKNYKNLIF